MNACHRAAQLIIVVAIRGARQASRAPIHCEAEYPTELTADEGDQPATCGPPPSRTRLHVRTSVIITVISSHQSSEKMIFSGGRCRSRSTAASHGPARASGPRTTVATTAGASVRRSAGRLRAKRWARGKLAIRFLQVLFASALLAQGG